MRVGASFSWSLYALWRSPSPTPVVLAAGATLTARSPDGALVEDGPD
ncbi:hypothetical protein ACFVUB_30940 [Streptomyces niveus]